MSRAHAAQPLCIKDRAMFAVSNPYLSSPHLLSGVWLSPRTALWSLAAGGTDVHITNLRARPSPAVAPVLAQDTDVSFYGLTSLAPGLPLPGLLLGVRDRRLKALASCWWRPWVPAPAPLPSLRQTLGTTKEGLRVSPCWLVSPPPATVQSAAPPRSSAFVSLKLHLKGIQSRRPEWLRRPCGGHWLLGDAFSYFRVLGHVLATAEPAGKSDCEEDGTHSHERRLVENRKYRE